jgi:hypothetical protein
VLRYFTRQDTVVVWENLLKNYTLPTVTETKIRNAGMNIPYISLPIALALVFMLIKKKSSIKRQRRKWWQVIVSAVLLGILFFPVQARLEIPLLKENSFISPDASELVSQLLKNTYRAFDFREESEIFDKLALSTHGDLLSTIYLQTRKNMVIENQGGARAKIREVDVLDVKEIDSDEAELAYDCSWQVRGTVGHWGHLHNRTNRYRAVLHVRAVEGTWKLTAIDMIEEERL